MLTVIKKTALSTKRAIKNHRLIAGLYLLSLLFIIFSATILFINQKNFIPPIIIRFDTLNSIDRLGTIWDVWHVWVYAPIFFFLNIILTIFSAPRLKILTYLFAGTTLLISIFSLILAAVIVDVN